jgi:hypothetical protein
MRIQKVKYSSILKNSEDLRTKKNIVEATPIDCANFQFVLSTNIVMICQVMYRMVARAALAVRSFNCISPILIEK